MLVDAPLKSLNIDWDIVTAVLSLKGVFAKSE